MIKTESDFLRVAMASYDNPSCVDLKEFEQDIKRISGSKRLVTKFVEGETVNFRLMLNSFVVLYNLFGNKTNELLLYKYSHDDRAMSVLIPIASFLGRLDKNFDKFSNVSPNKKVIEELENL